MKISKKLLFGLIFCAVGINQVSAATQKSITFQNQRGSTMTLHFHNQANDTGSVTGTFTSAVGDCKADVGVPMPLTGFFNGNAISLTVNFTDCKAVATMAGNLTNDHNELNTIWLVTLQSQDPIRKDWNSNVIGSDNFKKVG